MSVNRGGISKRHPNCTPMTVIADRAPPVSMSSQTRQHEREQIEREVVAYLASGGNITSLDSCQARPASKPAFNPGGFDR